MARLQLDTPVQFVRGVGPVRAEQLRAVGIQTVSDLLHHIPFRYEHRPPSQPIGAMRLDETVTVVGEISRVRTRGGFGRETVIAEVSDGTGRCLVRWFNSAYLKDKLGPGVIIAATGKVSQYRQLGSLTNPKFRIVERAEAESAIREERFDPVYPAGGALTARDIARFVAAALPEVAGQIEETLPEALRRRRGLPPRRTALERCHHPTRDGDAETARRRLAYDELLMMQLAMQLRRAQVERSARATPITTTDHIDKRIRARLGFSLTAGQEAAVREIAADLARERPMRRLLQADVGAGKTAVALYAALATIANRRQAAFLAPTEILAEQHYRKICRMLSGSAVRVDLLAGNMPRRDRDQTLAALRSGESHLIVGTHALLESDVRFAALGLVIVDEQHRFGVRQRAKLRSKGADPHYLVLTATPIPRTLAMTVFGDLDVSRIHDLPPGRRPIGTRLIRPTELRQAWDTVRDALHAGRQAYIVYPLVERTDALPLKAAVEEVDRLREGALSDFRVELLHGQMPREQKDRVMNRFAGGEVDALVATTVVEVGIDVPNATVMVVHHAERFGLSQLHQLRGRVGRGTQRSTCLLMLESDSEPALERLSILCGTADGFAIAEEDLRLRGPGEVIGRRQHGLPEFRVADLARDADLLETTREDASAIVEADAALSASRHQALRRELLDRFGEALSLVDVA